MTTRKWHVLGWATCLLAWVLALSTLVLVVWNGLPLVPNHQLDIVGFLAIAVLFGPVFAVILPRRRHPVLLVVAAASLGCSACALMMVLLMLPNGPTGWAAGFMIHLGGWLWAPGLFGTMAVLPWLVTDRRLDPVPRVMLLLGTSGIVLTVPTFVGEQRPGMPANPLFIDLDWWMWLVDRLNLWPGRLCFAVGVAASIHLIHRCLRGPVSKRHGLAWLAAGQAILTVSFVPVFFQSLRADAPTLSNVLAWGLLGSLAFLPAAVLVVVLRQRMWGIDVAVSRSIVGGLMSAAVVGLYVTVVWVGGAVLPRPDEFPGILAVGVVAIAAQPLRTLIQRRVDALIYGSSRTPDRLLKDLGEHMSVSRGRSSDLQELVERLRAGLQLGLAELRHDGGSPAARSTSGNCSTDTVELPLVKDGAVTGTLLIAPRSGERLDRKTLETIGQLSGLVAVALQLVRVNQDLEGARERLVEVRHQERRLLRRELHDELGPALAGISLGLAAVQNGTTSSRRTQALLDQLQRELSDRAEDVRTMARALLPPALDDGRFEDALRVLVTRFDDTGLTVRASVTGADELDVKRQVALYHVAAEALVNAYRHAHAATCIIDVVVTDDGAVTLTVADDGQGFHPQSSDGVGLHSMRERAAELGGSFEAVPSLGGTTVRMRLP